MSYQITTSVIALGANIPGLWGCPSETLRRAIREMGKLGLTVNRMSRLHVTKPVGLVRQPDYHNLVIVVDNQFPPAYYLRKFKALERDAGRRLTSRWGPRPLDIDIVCVGGRRVAERALRSTSAWLSLPHPAMIARDFVLCPMAEVAPHWRHPGLGLTPRNLILRRNTPRPAFLRHRS